MDDLYLLPEEEEPFFEWAFGPGDYDNALKLMERWNTLHGEELRLKPEGTISEDRKKMILIWRERDRHNKV